MDAPTYSKNDLLKFNIASLEAQTLRGKSPRYARQLDPE
jgi:hypothetical protein